MSAMDFSKLLNLPYSIELETKSHAYTVDKIEKPGVNGMMDTMGLMSPWAKKSDAAKAFGTEGHLIVQLLLSNSLGEYSEAFEPWMNGILQFKDDLKPEPIVLEWKGYHELFGYCGTLDFFGWLHGKPGFHWLLDWKFWDRPMPSFVSHAGIQTSAYSELVRQYIPVECGAVFRAVVWFFQNGYKFIPLINQTDFTIWRSVRTLYTYRELYNLNIKTEGNYKS